MCNLLNLLAISLFVHAVTPSALMLSRDSKGGGERGGSLCGEGEGCRRDISGAGGTPYPGPRRKYGGIDVDNSYPTTPTTYHQGSTTSSGAGRGGSGDTGFEAVEPMGVLHERKASFFGGGGGSRLTLEAWKTFKGREVGGGTRGEVPGTRSYGSGYPYTAPNIRFDGVSGQPFPFGFWPLFWNEKEQSREYDSLMRPGDKQVIVELRPKPTSLSENNTLGDGKLYMVGDKESATALFSLLKDPKEWYSYGCDALSVDVNTEDYSLQSDIQFDNVIQYYRSSSFALAFTGYNNSYAVAPLNETAGLGWGDSTPLPSTLASSLFLQCVNNTILAALPIIDAEPYTLPRAILAVIIAGSAVIGISIWIGILFWIKAHAKPLLWGTVIVVSENGTSLCIPPGASFQCQSKHAAEQDQPPSATPKPAAVPPCSSHDRLGMDASPTRFNRIYAHDTPGAHTRL